MKNQLTQFAARSRVLLQRLARLRFYFMDTPKTNELKFHARATFGPVEGAEIVVPAHEMEKLERENARLREELRRIMALSRERRPIRFENDILYVPSA